jgi:small-conductance mechanosensitive channel
MKDGNGDVTLEEAEMVVHEVSKERKSLTRSMRDVDSAIRKLDDVLVVIVLIIAIFIMISFLNSDFATTLATAGTALLSLSFIFAATCQEILASILFLFYKHPFDVGDRVDINGCRYIVKELSLLFTIFKRLDGTIVQVNNAVLNSAWIENIRRSQTMSEVVQLSVDFGTSFAQIQNLRKEMLVFVKSNSRDYAGDLEIEIMDAKGLDKLLLQVVIKHKGNWQNDALRAHRRNKVFPFLTGLM